MAVRCHKGRWSCYWNDENGKRQEKDFGKGPVAEFKANELNTRLGFGKRQRNDPSVVLFPSFMTDYLKWVKSQNVNNPGNYNNTLSFMKSAILPFFGQYDIYALIHSDLTDFVLSRQETKTKQGNRRKNCSINREIDEIQQYLNWCVQEKKILNNPLSGYRRLKDDRSVIEPPSVEEFNDLLANSKEHLQRFLLIAFYAGPRPGKTELLKLTWDDVYFDIKKIRIRSADKNGLNSRSIEIHPEFYPILRHWWLKDQNKGVKTRHIIHWNQRAVKSIKTAFKYAKKEAGITRRLRPYDIRHAHVTLQLEGGADIKAVSENVGHKSVDTTRKVYQHVSDRIKQEAIHRLPKVDMPDAGIKKLG